jgi:hypothetical protein
MSVERITKPKARQENDGSTIYMDLFAEVKTGKNEKLPTYGGSPNSAGNAKAEQQ